ncbi:MAG: hypothetical protein A4E48_00826 [Methanosaeta sp. PtaU1.Bin060]|nr:MAG: hypothetical protein A4E48_00826 [Methanosaeta sp. PtaU1.Bin060]
MRKSAFAIPVLMAVLFATFCLVAGASIDSATVHKYVNIYNNRIDGSPEVIKSLVGNEKVEVNVINGSRVYRVGIETENARVSRIVEGGIDNPSITINATEDAINRIKGSSDPISEFQKQRANSQVDIVGHTWLMQAKLNLAFSSLLEFFYKIFFG